MSDVDEKSLREAEKMPSIKDRIRRAYSGYGTRYYDMLIDVFPKQNFPNAFRYSSNGGPPGCAMPFLRALREMGGSRDWKKGTVWLPPERKK